MKQYTAKTFNIPALKGISAKNIEEHIKLYQAYVKNTNLVLEKIEELEKDSEKNMYLIGELRRRFSFEYNGVRNHEIYFATFEGGATNLNRSSLLAKSIEAEWGSIDVWTSSFKNAGMTRGIGWAVLWYDKKDRKLVTSWVDEQHLGQLNGCEMILAMDMWEHAFVSDYQPTGKKQYIEDFFANINWKVIEQNFESASK